MTDHDILSAAEREALNEVMQAPAQAEQWVLIVDDDPMTRDLLAEFLTLHEIVCLTASNEKQALELLDSERPIGLMLTDLRMVPHDGLHLIRKVRESLFFPCMQASTTASPSISARACISSVALLKR